MEEAWQSIPQFWKGVVASLVAAILFAGFVLAIRVSTSSVGQWFRNRRRSFGLLRDQLASPNPTIRIEANLQILLNLLKWLAFGAIFWICSESLFFLVAAGLVFSARILAAASIVMALRWAWVYQELPTVNEQELREIVVGIIFRLFFNPPSRSKPITFEANGEVGEGGNDNERRWRIVDGKLEVLAADGKVYSRFLYDPRTGTFMHTNDPDTRSIRNQYILPLGPKNEGSANGCT